MKSIWTENNNCSGRKLPDYIQLKENIKTDVLIIGGGLAGLLSAYKLKERGINCIVAEADRICSGTTKNTTAKITSQHGLIYNKLIKKFGIEKAQMYLKANESAIEEYKRLSEIIDCDFEKKDAYVYTCNSPEDLEKEQNALESLGFPVSHTKSSKLPFSICGALKFENQGQFNPLKFASGIIKDIKIYEHTMIHRIDNMTAITDHGSVRAENIIVATHFPFLNKHGSYFLKQFQERSYVMALENGPDVGGMYIDGSGNGLSFRNYKDKLLIGGGSHRTGKPGGGWSTLERFAEEHYPDCDIACRWAAQDCMTLDGIPYIGSYSKMTPGLYVATGFNKWGMTSAMVSAMILSDLIEGRNNPYAPVFSPSRNMLRKQLYINGFEAIKNLLSPSAKRCSHLGCSLKWNPHEHSWDCPCHGSRFSENGKIIDNPAVKDIDL